MFNRGCQRQNEFNQNFTGDGPINMDIDVNMTSSQMNVASQPNTVMQGVVGQPIIEPMQERIVNRTIMHEVPHVCPIRTKIINNHVYRHTYAANIDNIYSVLKASILRPFCFANFCIYVIITVVFYMGGVLHD